MLIILKADYSVIMTGKNILTVIKHNVVSGVCICAIIVGIIGYLIFRDRLRSSKEFPITIKECKSINYENLSFLTTYVIPLICFPMETAREIVVMFLLIIAIGCIFIKTNLFYSNPSLVLLGFSVYQISDKSQKLVDAVVIAKGKLQIGDKISYLALGDNVYFAKKHSEKT